MDPVLAASRRLSLALAGIVAARRCGGCGDVLAKTNTGGAAARAWCGHCRDRWGPTPGWWSSVGDGCAGWAAAEYRGVVRRSVLVAKQGGHAAAAQLLTARWPAGMLEEGCDITWVPGHPRRTAGRPDAGRALAAQLARHEGRGVAAPRALLLRSPRGRRQAGLPDADRRADPEALGLGLRLTPAPTVVIVDDVRTTGTTLDHAARLLRAGGARDVVALVVASAPGRAQ